MASVWPQKPAQLFGGNCSVVEVVVLAVVLVVLLDDVVVLLVELVDVELVLVLDVLLVEVVLVDVVLVVVVVPATHWLLSQLWPMSHDPHSIGTPQPLSIWPH